MYTKGRGSIKMRAVAEIGEGKRGEQRIVVTEVPYQTSVEVIGQKIAELVNDRKIEGIRDVRNESSGVTNRLVIELRRDANANVVLNQLYKHTPMQTSFAAHILALVDGVPRLLSLDQRDPRLRQPPDRCGDPAHPVPPAQGAGARAHRRRSREGARDDRRDHRAHQEGRRRRDRACGAHEEAVRVLRHPGRLHPRHAAAAVDPARGQEAPRRAGRAPGDDQGARGDPEEQDEAPQGDQGRAPRAEEEVRRRSADAAHRRHGRDRHPRHDRGRRGRGRPHEQGLHQDGRGRRVPPAEPGGSWRQGESGPRRRLRRQAAHHHGALVPAAVLEPRQGVPAPRARDPDEGPHRARHRARST